MINNTKQVWEVGRVVRVGFLALTIKAALATPGDGLPDAYILANQAGTQLYKFVPHHGLEKLSPLEARELIADAWVRADKVAAQAIAKGRRDARAIADINYLIFAVAS